MAQFISVKLYAQLAKTHPSVIYQHFYRGWIELQCIGNKPGYMVDVEKFPPDKFTKHKPGRKPII